MGNIKGIRIDFKTAGYSWSPTKDKLFLGVYGGGGGREFRLNGNFQIDQPNEVHKIALGSVCCDAPGYLQVQYSTGLGDNDPLLNPIEIGSVDYVYLRKETEDSTVANDDVLTLTSATVLLCDASGNNRRFRKRGKLVFSDEAGLQHWIGEVDPPGCQITVTLTKIEHKDLGGHIQAGNKWTFNFGAGLQPVTNNIVNGLYHHSTKKDEWGIDVNQSVTFFVPGCCGHSRDIFIYGSAKEKDIFKNDGAEWTRGTSANCSKHPTTQTDSLSLEVYGNVNWKASEITFHYEITSVCND